jgi:hypothetical protein
VVVALAACIAFPGEAMPAQGNVPGAGGRVFTFSKDFPGSVPPFYSVTVRESGEAVYKTEPEDAQPIEFRLPPDVTSEIFALAGKLGDSPDQSLESKRRVANMGKKTVELHESGKQFTTSFNHTEVPEALELLGLFERISATQQHAIRLEYLVQFDRLGVVKALLQLEIDLDNGRLVGADQLVPLLERIRNDRAIAQIAKGRAAQILGKIQAEKL